MNSCRFSVHILPVRVSQSIAVAHSGSVSSTSRTKPCRCLISEVMIRRRRGSGMFFQRSSAMSVRLASVTCGIVRSPLAKYFSAGLVGRSHFRRHDRGLAALGFGSGEIELDLHPVRIEQEQLVEALVVDPAFLELDLVLLQVRDHSVEIVGAEG